MKPARVRLSPAFVAYRKRTLDFVGGRDPVALLRTNPARIERAVAGLSELQLKRRPAAGKWSIHEQIGHMADVEAVWAYRWRVALATPGSPVLPFDQDTWAEEFHYRRMPFRSLLELFRELREANLKLVRSVAPALLKRGWLAHPERGRETMAYLLQFAAGHDLNHLGQIHAIRKKFGWEPKAPGTSARKRAPARARTRPRGASR